MDIDRYLARIGLKTRPEPTLRGLTILHSAHLLAIPYENLDVQLGRPVTIAREPIYEKLVERGRGGWCYEMNGLFGWALGELGFDVRRATGSVMRETAGEASNGNHLVLRVELPEGLFLADVGFGDGPRDAIPVRIGAFASHGFDFSVARAGEGWWRLHNDPRGGASSFDFNLDAADENLLAAKCEFLQSNPASPFVQNLVCQRHTRTGLSILRGRVLKKLTPKGTSEHLIASADELVATLKSTFALDVPHAASLWPAICERHDAVFAQR
ncbi:MAG TPA: arylamine N-acetyltransferase [Rhizomicrobium sp.]|jgi:N-hydroxyarylamine O-acetyltransferase